MNSALAQSVYTYCGSQKSIKYKVTGKPGSIFHWSIEGGTIISDSHRDTIEVIWGNNPGSYSLSVYEETGSGCLGNNKKTSIYILPSPIVDMGKIKVICEGDGLILNPGPGYVNYRWQDGAMNPVFVAKKTGLYWVEVTNREGCTTRDSIKVVVNPLPKVNLGIDTTLCSPDELMLDAGNTGSFYSWSNGSATQTILAHESDGQIWVKVTDANGCAQSDTIQILRCDRRERLSIANAFTPNSDGHNDYWEIEGAQYYPEMKIQIYDRWGIEIYRTEHGYSVPWDGTSNGKKMPTGAYFYVIRLGDGSKDITGSITIIR